MKWILMGISILLGVFGQFFMKKGVSILSGVSFFPISSMIKTLTQPYVFLGFVLYGMSSLLWLTVISKLPLSVAYPMLSLGYICVILLSWAVFKEPLGAMKIAGVLCICLGVFLIAK